MHISPLNALAFAALTPSVCAGILKINNWCNSGISMVKSKQGSCDAGPDGRCIRDGGQPWRVGPGNGQSIIDHPWDGDAVSLKISKDGVDGVLQFEYSQAFGEWGGIWWDLSDLDGRGGGLVGTPFAGDDVGVTPTGNGSKQGTCVNIRCAAHTTCYDSYQHPDDPNTKYCPLDTGDMWLDLCMPRDLFNQNRMARMNEAGFKNLTDTTPPPSLLKYHKQSRDLHAIQFSA